MQALPLYSSFACGHITGQLLMPLFYPVIYTLKLCKFVLAILNSLTGRFNYKK